MSRSDQHPQESLARRIVRCPCCGRRTLEGSGQYEWCGLCLWEDDPHDRDDPERGHHANGVSLSDARDNYLKTGLFAEGAKRLLRGDVERSRLNLLWSADTDGLDGVVPAVVKDSLDTLTGRSIHVSSDRVWPDLRPLLPLRDRLRYLRIDAPLVDVSAVNDFVGLRHLAIGPRGASTGVIELSRLSQLQSLSIEGKVSVDLSGGESLTRLFLSRTDKDWGDFVSSLQRLEHLTLLSPVDLPAVFPSSLRELDVSYIAQWPSGWSMEGGENTVSLRLTGVDVTDLRSFSRIAGLETLTADDVPLRSSQGPGRADRYQESRLGRV